MILDMSKVDGVTAEFSFSAAFDTDTQLIYDIHSNSTLVSVFRATSAFLTSEVSASGVRVNFFRSQGVFFYFFLVSVFVFFVLFFQVWLLENRTCTKNSTLLLQC